MDTRHKTTIKVIGARDVVEGTDTIRGQKVRVLYGTIDQLCGNEPTCEEDYVIWVIKSADGGFLYTYIWDDPESDKEPIAWWPAVTVEDAFSSGLNALKWDVEDLVGYVVEVTRS